MKTVVVMTTQVLDPAVHRERKKGPHVELSLDMKIYIYIYMIIYLGMT